MREKGSIELENLNKELFETCFPKNRHIDLEKLEETLKKGADANSLHEWQAFTSRWGNEGESRFPPLQIIAASDNASDAATLLIRFGGLLELDDPYTGNNVLHTTIAFKNAAYAAFLIDAIKTSETSTVKQLLNQKDRKQDWQNTPLILALKKGMQETAELLLTAGADGSIPDRFGTEPIHWAALLRYDNIIEQLLSQKINPGRLNKFNHTALQLYEYEPGPLDFEFKLKYEPTHQTVEVSLSTNLPEISEHRFHGFHRKKQAANPRISQLLTTEHQPKLSLQKQYVENFQMQDAIARSARFVTGMEYKDKILPVLQSEGQRFYGLRHTLPDYAPSNSQVMFGGLSRRQTPNLQVTHNAIIRSMASHSQIDKPTNRRNQAPQSSQDLETKTPSATSIPIVESSRDMFFHPLLRKSPSLLGLSLTTSSHSIPEDLKKALKDSSMLTDCVTKGFVSMESLIDLKENKPFVINALRCSNIYQGLCNNNITVEQLSNLTEEQVRSIVHKFQGNELHSKVVKYLEHNQVGKSLDPN